MRSWRASPPWMRQPRGACRSWRMASWGCVSLARRDCAAMTTTTSATATAIPAILSPAAVSTNKSDLIAMLLNDDWFPVAVACLEAGRSRHLRKLAATGLTFREPVSLGSVRSRNIVTDLQRAVFVRGASSLICHLGRACHRPPIAPSSPTAQIASCRVMRPRPSPTRWPATRSSSSLKSSVRWPWAARRRCSTCECTCAQGGGRPPHAAAAALSITPPPPPPHFPGARRCAQRRRSAIRHHKRQRRAGRVCRRGGARSV